MHRPLKPGVYERPVFRFRFSDPNGETQQSTLSSTWTFSSWGKGFTSEENDIRLKTVTELFRQHYEQIGCKLLSMDIINTTTVEIEGSIGK